MAKSNYLFIYHGTIIVGKNKRHVTVSGRFNCDAESRADAKELLDESEVLISDTQYDTKWFKNITKNRVVKFSKLTASKRTLFIDVVMYKRVSKFRK